MHTVLRWLGLLSPWLLFFWALHYTWDAGTYYRYGWFVPIATAMLWLRHMPRNASMSERPLSLRFLLFLIIPSFATLLIFRLIERTDPGWRLPLLLHGLFLTGASVVMLAKVYSRAFAWRTIPMMAFPLTAVPLPSVIESPLVNALTRHVLEATQYAMNFLGHPVEASGNLLLVSDQTIEIDEACSGIRSLQALFMLTCFFGIWFRIKPRNLVVLVLAPIVLCIVVNTSRAIALTFISIVYGHEAYATWHDAIGLLAFSISVILLYLWITFIGEDRPVWSNHRSKHSKALSVKRLAIAIGIVMIGIELIANARFRHHVTHNAITFPWTFKFETREGYYSVTPLALSKVGLAHFGGDQTAAASINFPDGQTLDIGYIAFQPDNPRAWFGIYGHSLTGCMRTSGTTYLGESEPRYINIGDHRLAVQCHTFIRTEINQTIYAFRMTGLEEKLIERSHSQRLKRLQMALKGDCRQAYQMILAGATGFADEGDALLALQNVLNHSAVSVPN